MDAITLHKINPSLASDADYADITAFRNLMRAEIDPSESPRSVEYATKSLKNIPPIATLHLWSAKKANKLVGMSNIVIMDLEENKHLAQASIEVLSEYRQQGIAKQLLSPIFEVAQQHKKEILIEDTNSRVPAGEAFMKRLNAKAGLAAHINQLLLSELDTSLMQTWQDQAKARAQDFELVSWEGSVPEEQLAAYCTMKDLMNTQPLDDLDVEDTKTTPELVRQLEAHRQARGETHWTLIVKHKPTGDFAGFTETIWNPEDAITLQQDGTAVMPKYRGKGLGRWLKATMVLKLKQELPQLERVRTGNADSNDAMLKINNEMGFKPFQSTTLWQVSVKDLAEYLAIQ